LARKTGPWKVGELASLLQHGTDRLSAAERLKDSQVNYLLVTSADVDGVARTLRQGSFGESPRKLKLPAMIARAVPKDAAGRIGITRVGFAENASGLFDGHGGITLETALKKS
jgi:hypothetical protein